MEQLLNGKAFRDCADCDLYAEWERLSWLRSGGGGFDKAQLDRLESFKEELKKRNVLHSNP
jgi:hypothetical protein